MKKYIGIKLIQAEPCSAERAGEILKRPINTENADEQGNGYIVTYPDGYMSWSPKKQFEDAYFDVTNSLLSRNLINKIDSLVEGRN